MGHAVVVHRLDGAGHPGPPDVDGDDDPAAVHPRLRPGGVPLPSFSAAGMARYRGASPPEALANFVAHQDDSTSPPGPKTSWLGEILVHSQDIRGALGIAHTSPVDAARDVAQFYAGSNALIGAKDRVAGLTLRATDTEWSHGSGPEVSGPVMSLVMAMTGRAPALEALSGPGVDSLRARCG